MPNPGLRFAKQEAPECMTGMNLGCSYEIEDGCVICLANPSPYTHLGQLDLLNFLRSLCTLGISDHLEPYLYNILAPCCFHQLFPTLDKLWDTGAISRGFVWVTWTLVLTSDVHQLMQTATEQLQQSQRAYDSQSEHWEEPGWVTACVGVTGLNTVAAVPFHRSVNTSPVPPLPQRLWQRPCVSHQGEARGLGQALSALCILSLSSNTFSFGKGSWRACLHSQKSLQRETDLFHLLVCMCASPKWTPKLSRALHLHGGLDKCLVSGSNEMLKHYCYCSAVTKPRNTPHLQPSAQSPLL